MSSFETFGRVVWSLLNDDLGDKSMVKELRRLHYLFKNVLKKNDKEV